MRWWEFEFSFKDPIERQKFIIWLVKQELRLTFIHKSDQQWVDEKTGADQYELGYCCLFWAWCSNESSDELMDLILDTFDDIVSLGSAEPIPQHHTKKK